MPRADRSPLRRLVHRLSRLSLPATVVAALLGVNVLAVAGIVSARRDARLEAEQELRLETEMQARSLEALLSDLRADLVYLAQSPALAEALSRLGSEDPTTRRWSRLDLEGTLLLFLQAQPALESLTLLDGRREALVRLGRRGGVPILMSLQGRPVATDRRTIGRFGVVPPAPTGTLVEATLRPGGLLSLIPTEGPGKVSLVTRLDSAPAGQATFTAVASVQSTGWEPSVDWRLVRQEERSVLVASVDRLTRRFRTAVILDMTIVLLTGLAGWLFVRQTRRAERFAAESRHQAHLRELERRLAHSEKLASLGRLSAGLAHEINNPLEGMGNYLGLLESDLEQQDVVGARGRLAKVREGLERAAGVLRRVLVYSRPSRADGGEELDLAGVVSETVEFARGLRDLEGVTLRCVKVAPMIVRGDSGALGQLVLNLVLNAGQVQGPGGQIEVSLEARGTEAVLRVADRGPGIDRRVEKRLFEPFQSMRGSSGLGLSVCQGIARSHSGTISASRRVGGGTVFEVTLPRLIIGGSTESDPVAVDGGA